MPNVIVIKNSSETFTLNFSVTQNATTQTTNVFLKSTLQFFISFLNNKLTEKKKRNDESKMAVSEIHVDDPGRILAIRS